jgi:phage replication O-like protein O
LSEKLKPNFTAIPNVLLDEAMRTLTPGAVKTLFAICRYTYGWGKKSDRISLTQLAEMTGMDRANVSRSVRQLGSLLIVTPGDPRTRRASEYQINVEIPDQDLVSLRQQGLVSQEQQTSVRASVNLPTIRRNPKKEDKSGAKSPESFPNKRSRKLTRPEPAALEAFERFYEAYPRHAAKVEGLKAWLNLSPSPELIPAIMAGAERYKAETADSERKYIKHPATWLNARRWEDEPVNGNGNGKPPAAKDVGAGNVEVDGRIMPREMYERRYGKAAN